MGEEEGVWRVFRIMLFFSVGRGSTERLVRYHWRPETVHPIVLVPEIHSVMWGSGLHMKYLTGQTSYKHQFSSVQWLSRVQLFGTPWTAARQASLYISTSRSLLRLMSMESVIRDNNFWVCLSDLGIKSLKNCFRGWKIS